ncbi:FMN-dependent dehydrogenase [Aspergillus ambiguus]|uniref:alpha-hydroxy acid oxidase n=1 Tax=Aspergillus ambiguus TaxID=176160 RepID=UPI003CCD4A7D
MPYLKATAATRDSQHPRGGYKALVITVDTPVLGNRINERKTPLTLPSHLTLVNFEGSNAAGQPPRPTFNRILIDSRTAKEDADVRRTAGSAVHNSVVTWETFTTLRKENSMKIILKGIMTSDDAETAFRHGVGAIVMSNHGGRQLDSTFLILGALPGIAATVKGRMPIMLDAIALGAQFVLVGRPVIWRLSYSCQRGVEAVLNILERELSRAMALAGATTITGITMSYLGIPKSSFWRCKIVIPLT